MALPPLRAGDPVGVVAPGGVVDPDRLDAGRSALAGLGFDVRLGAAVLGRQHFLAGPDDDRLADLQFALDARDLRGVVCARGGYGAQRIVPRLDLAGLRSQPKAVVGYSDATSVLAALTNAGIPAVHGPMAAVDFAHGLTPAAAAHFQRLLADDAYAWTLPVPTPVRPGRAEGPLVGGCLSVLAALFGTPWALRTRGTIVLLEDTNEWPYRLDRLLLQARQAGLFDGVAGVVLGSFDTCRPSHDLTALDVLRAAFADAPFPVAAGLSAGHFAGDDPRPQMALPLGVRVRLDADAGTLANLDPLVGPS